jgi:uncharacterized protein
VRDLFRFEWDPAKAEENLRKHGISFVEALTVFWDANGLLLDDSAHSEVEDRFLLIGMSETLRILVVVHCYRLEDTTIRLIGARKATASERDRYVRER